VAGNGYDSGRGESPRQGRQGWGRAPEQHGGGQDAPAAPPPGAFGSYRGEQQPGQETYGRGAAAPGPYAAAPYPDPHGGQPSGEPEYFGGGPATQDPYGTYDDNPGHTRSFSIDEVPYGGDPGLPPGAAPTAAAKSRSNGAPDQDNVAVYRAGGQVGPHAVGPRLHWRELLTGMYLNPSRTFDRMRDHQVWLPALTVSLLYGVLAVFGFGDTRSSVMDSTFSLAAWTVLGAAVCFTLTGATLGAVTHTLARRMGGDGQWQPTIGLSVLIAWTTDVPRLLFALFLPPDGAFVQVLGWATWLLCAGLLATMVRRVHDLPWGKAAGAAAVQLVILLILIKLPTLS
jgi:hypothetical protein